MLLDEINRLKKENQELKDTIKKIVDEISHTLYCKESTKQIIKAAKAECPEEEIYNISEEYIENCLDPCKDTLLLKAIINFGSYTMEKNTAEYTAEYIAERKNEFKIRVEMEKQKQEDRSNLFLGILCSIIILLIVCMKMN